MEVRYIKCDICYEETKEFTSYYVETNLLERQNIRYDICKNCEERINKLIQDIRDEEGNLPF